MMNALSALAALLYAFAAVAIWHGQAKHWATARAWAWLCAASALHILALLQVLSFNFTASLSWVAALMAMLSGATLARLGECFLPLLAITAALIMLCVHAIFPGHSSDIAGWQIHLHAALALLAYATLSLAGLQATLLLYVERKLRHRASVSGLISPLSRLERHLFQLTATGFGLLTLTLLSGTLFISDWFAQHIVHKTVLTLAAWMIFGVLLIGHWRFGWRGKRAAWFTLIGMGTLLTAFFGSKLVLELILRRA
jgi:ABC-type uncharacterized transport system permease subunit